MDADAIPHEFIFLDEAGFNLPKVRRRWGNLIGHRIILSLRGQRGGHITMNAAIMQNGVHHHHTSIDSYNMAHIFTFLDGLHNIITEYDQMHARCRAG